MIQRGLAIAIALLGAASAPGGEKLDYMAPFPEKRRSEAHVDAPSQRVPKDFVDGQWAGIIAASDGNTYFSVSSHSPNHNAQFYRYDPDTGDLEHLIDVGRWAGEEELVGKASTQGKIHSRIYEAHGKLYCTTTSAHGDQGRPYRGGHFLSYDLETNTFRELAHYKDKGGGGLLTMHYEPVRERLYAIHQRDRTLIYYDLEKETITEIGSIDGPSPFQCRVLVSDDRGNVYGSTQGGKIFKYDPSCGKLSALLTEIPHDPNAPQPKPGEKGWRKTLWTPIVKDPRTDWYYLVRGNDEYLSRMKLPPEDTPHRARIEGLAPFGFQPSGKDQPRWASLGMAIKGRTIYYCSYPLWEPQAHLMSYDIETGEVTDHGPIVTDGGRRVAEIHSLVVGSDGTLHAVAMTWSLKGTDDPANPWANRAGTYFHARFMTIDPRRHFVPAR